MAMMKLALLFLNVFVSPPYRCLAFTSPSATGEGLRLRPGSRPTRPTPRRAHEDGRGVGVGVGVGDGDGDGDAVSAAGVVVSRRSALSAGAAAAAVALLAPRPSAAVVGGAAQSAARVESWPGVETLEPLYEFKLSIDAIVAGVQDPATWDYIKKRLDAFFSGWVINEKNYYMGVGIQYMNDLQYDKAELPNYVLLDKETRFDALENTMKSLDILRTLLAEGRNADAAAVEDLAKSSQRSLQLFFDMIPDQEVKAVGELFEHVKKADINGDGRLSDDETVFLSPVEQELWKRRVSKFG